MDAAEIARLREIERKAEAGPWEGPDENGAIYRLDGDHGTRLLSRIDICTVEDFDVAEFIVEARKSFGALLTALEQVQKERDDCCDDITALKREIDRWTELHSGAYDQRDAAQKDAQEAARALLGEALDDPVMPLDADLRARIEAMLEKKP